MVFDCFCLVLSLSLTALVKCDTFLDRLEEAAMVLVVYTLLNKEILRLKHKYLLRNLPAQLAQSENFNEQASECRGSDVSFYKDAYTSPVILPLFI